MKHISNLATTVLAIILILILLSTGLPNSRAQAAAATQTDTTESAPESQSSCKPDRNIHVTGTAAVNVPPNRALIQLGVQSNGKTPEQVQARNAVAISKVIEALNRSGVESKDIATDWYVIEPLYEDYDSLQIKGYRIYNVIAVTMRAVEKTSEAIAAAFQAGANQVVNVEFYTSDLRQYRDQARAMAMKAASEKASALARAAGADTDCVLNISENSWSYFQGNNWWSGANAQNLWTQNAVQNAAPAVGDAPPTDESPVRSGQISIRAEVSVTFALK